MDGPRRSRAKWHEQVSLARCARQGRPAPRTAPPYLIPTEWASFKSLEPSDQTAIPNEYKELIGLAVSGATRCRYCYHFHTEGRGSSAPARTRSPRPR